MITILFLFLNFAYGETIGERFTALEISTQTLEFKLPISTYVILSSYTTTATMGFNCITGSTLTINTDFSRYYLITFDGTIQNNSNTDIHIAPLIDGNLVPIPDALNKWKTIRSINNQEVTCSMIFITPKLSSGTHTFCVSMWADVGTTFIPYPHPTKFQL